MKRTFCLIAFILVVIAAAAVAQSPALYPGAVPSYPGSGNEYLVKDDYAQVRAFYARNHGEPWSENAPQRHLDGSAFFQYRETELERTGVRLTWGNSRDREVARILDSIFDRLQTAAAGGHATAADLVAIRQEYAYLATRYFPRRRDQRGNLVCATAAIYSSYEERLPSGIDVQDAGDIMAEAQRLTLAGRFAEAAELMKRGRTSTRQATDAVTSQETFDAWMQCLDELAANAYQVVIEIDAKVQIQRYDKGMLSDPSGALISAHGM